MIWWRRRRPSPETIEARERLEAARRDLAAAKADTPGVEARAKRMEDLASRNHFGPLVADALRGSRG